MSEQDLALRVADHEDREVDFAAVLALAVALNLLPTGVEEEVVEGRYLSLPEKVQTS